MSKTDPCAGCDANRPSAKFEGENNVGVPCACRDCARAALRRAAKLERLIVDVELLISKGAASEQPAKVKQIWLRFSAEAARIAKWGAK